MRTVTGFFISIATMGFATVACSPRAVDFTSDAAATSLSSTAVTDPPVTGTVQGIISDCNEALARGLIQTASQPIDFTATTAQCPFGQGDNLSKLDGQIRARVEQSFPLPTLPANAVVCDIGIGVSQQHFRYDDVFLLTLNGHVLATNDKTALMQRSMPSFNATLDTQSVPVYDYNWLSLRGLGFPSGADDYCVGASQGLATCQWPVTEKDGPIQLKFDYRLLINMSAAVTNNKLGLIITGDNDTSDCQHEDLKVGLTVKYFLK